MPEDSKAVEAPKEDPKDIPLVRELLDKAPVTTEHSIDLDGKPLRYKVTCGMLPLRDDKGEVEAGIFFMAYTAIDVGPRPLTFSFNGGPGSSSVWLHLGALGPKRAKMESEGWLPAPPYQLVDNPHTWLGFTDMVFIDPVGTGYSRALKPDGGKKFWGLKGDFESVGEAIRLYLTRYQRWASPLYLVGESYGTTRAAGLSDHLVDKGIAFNGILLVSSILNFQTADFTTGNDLPFTLFLPTYTAAAWFHGKLKGNLAKDLRGALAEAEKFAIGEYASALALGDSLTGVARAKIAQRLSQLTGLSPRYVDHTDLRINIHRFCKELLRDDRRTVGRLDSRFKGIERLPVGDEPENDPSMSAIMPPYTAMLNDYVRGSLGWETDLEYIIIGGLYGSWDWGNARDGHPDTSEALRAAFCKNHHLKVFIASGYYDLATPYFATEYTVNHLGLDASLRGQIETKYYEAGHMMYINEECLVGLADDVKGFIGG